MANESTPLVSATPAGEPSSSYSQSTMTVPPWVIPETGSPLWTVINLLLFVWSLTLLIDTLIGPSSPMDRVNGDQWYIAWNFIATLVWCIEVGILVWYHHGSSNANWSDRIQLALGVYFLLDSIQLFRKWQNPNVDLEEELIDLIVNTLAYLAMLVMTAMGWYKSIQTKVSEVITETPEPETAPRALGISEPLVEKPKDTEAGVTVVSSDEPPVADEPSTEKTQQDTSSPTNTATTSATANSQKRSSSKKRDMSKVKKRFPQFFRISEGKKGWGHQSQIGNFNSMDSGEL